MKSKQLSDASALPASLARPAPRWRATALALAAALALGAAPQDADALALGRVTVLSTLGEPLRAEIDVPQISEEEASSLRATLASPEAFRAAGLEYSPVLSSVQISLQRRPNGSQMLQLTGAAVNDPFVDVLIEANWATGRIVRNLTMLFDPPHLRAPTPIAAQVSPAATPRPVPAGAAEQTPITPNAAASTAAAAARARPAAAAEPRAAARPSRSSSPASQPTPANGQRQQVTVQAGDSAGRIAAANKPATVSLDQMLVALLRSNPDAFMDGNINRLKAGAVLDLPSADQASAISQGEARQTVVAQSRDFNEFRRRLAQGVSGSPQADAAGRSASGQLKAQVEEKTAAPATPDRLTLAKGSVQAQRAAAEERLARERSTRDADARVAELNKNIADLNRLASGAAAAAAAAASGPAAAAAPAIAAALPAAADSAPAAAPGASAAGAASSAAAPAVKPAASAAAKPAAAPGAAASGLVDTLTENPLVPAGGAGLLALLLGYGWYRMRQGRKAAMVDSSFLESRLQPDSFFGASGGQRIDTAEGESGAGSSMVYSPSQLDAAGDVDPVAEADVYLAYGRDLQAEEILKEALRVSPQRVAIHSKLLEIYARRRDVKAFDLVAGEVHALTQGVGTEWEHVAAMGHDIDPTNPMYQLDGGGAAPAVAPAATVATAVAAAATAIAQPAAAAQPPARPVDIDLDFSLDDTSTSGPITEQATEQAPLAPAFDDSPTASAQPTRFEPPAVQAPALEPIAAVAQPSGPASVLPDLDLSFDDEPTPPPAAAASAPLPPLAQAVKIDLPDLDLPGHGFGNGIDFDLPEPTASAPAPQPEPVAVAPTPRPETGASDSLMDFDLESLSFEPSGAATQAPAGADTLDLALPELTEDEAGDALATKLALAEEFNAIGDADGARSLAEEVLAEATGDLRQRAQRLLADIG